MICTKSRQRGIAHDVASSQTRTVWSRLELITRSSPGMKRAEEIECSCPRKVAVFLYSSSTFQSLMNRSYEHETKQCKRLRGRSNLSKRVTHQASFPSSRMNSR
jgi:hypothetical protein